jgi:ribosomal protein S18 acetylase RimI-like enzyme
VIRRATAADAAAVADVFVRSRRHNEPAIPPMVHPDTQALPYFREVVLPHRDVWLAVEGDDVVGFLALNRAEIDHLYLAPGWTRHGIGNELLALAKAERPDGLELWAFQSNTGACRFYERHGFVEVKRTDGRDNEERAPDVLYAWRPPSTPQNPR